jgi:hypothetical protein
MAKSIRELPVMEQLAIEQALFSRLGEDVSTKNPDSLRSACDQQVVDNYRAMGAKSYDVHVNGEKVGTYSVRVGKETPEKVSKRIAVRDRYAFDAYVKEHATEEVFEYVHLMMDNFASFMLESYGVLCDGCEVVEDVTPAQPAKVQGTTLRIDADKVAAVINGYLPTTLAGFIGGDADA